MPTFALFLKSYGLTERDRFVESGERVDPLLGEGGRGPVQFLEAIVVGCHISNADLLALTKKFQIKASKLRCTVGYLYYVDSYLLGLPEQNLIDCQRKANNVASRFQNPQ